MLYIAMRLGQCEGVSPYVLALLYEKEVLYNSVAFMQHDQIVNFITIERFRSI